MKQSKIIYNLVVNRFLILFRSLYPFLDNQNNNISFISITNLLSLTKIECSYLIYSLHALLQLFLNILKMIAIMGLLMLLLICFINIHSPKISKPYFPPVSKLAFP